MVPSAHLYCENAFAWSGKYGDARGVSRKARYRVAERAAPLGTNRPLAGADTCHANGTTRFGPRNVHGSLRARAQIPCAHRLRSSTVPRSGNQTSPGAGGILHRAAVLVYRRNHDFSQVSVAHVFVPSRPYDHVRIDVIDEKTVDLVRRFEG
jgi:hypothetical protein